MKKSIKSIVLDNEKKVIKKDLPDHDLGTIQLEISKATNQIKSDFSYKKRFLGGILHGFGAALGATIIFAIALSLTAKLIASSKHIQWLNKVIVKTNIEQLIDTTQSNKQ